MAVSTGMDMEYFTRTLNLVNLKTFVEIYNSVQQKRQPQRKGNHGIN